MGILLSFITGLFFVLGIFLNRIIKNKNNISKLAISLAFVVILNLIIFDIIPEVFENFKFIYNLYILFGLFLLKIIDLFVPHHDHEHHEKNDNIKEHNMHLEHISIITILSLSLHNVIECMALSTVSKSSLMSGIMMCLGIALHNIPLGFQIGNSLKKHRSIYTIILMLSGVVGAIICAIITIPASVTNFILCFTLGMLLYLAFFELASETIKSIKNKYTIYGIIIGVVVIVLTRLV